jgi:hypothetical protein
LQEYFTAAFLSSFDNCIILRPPIFFLLWTFLGPLFSYLAEHSAIWQQKLGTVPEFLLSFVIRIADITALVLDAESIRQVGHIPDFDRAHVQLLVF